MAFTVATKVIDGTITSSPGPSPAARPCRCSAAVPLETATACAAPAYSANAASNSAMRGPMDSHPDRYVAAMASISASVISTSARGTRHCMRPQPSGHRAVARWGAGRG